MQISEVVKVVAPNTSKGPNHAGIAIQTVQATDATKAINVHTASFASAA